MNNLSSVAVVDYGFSNLLNVIRALKKIGAEPEVLTTPDGLDKFDRVILPGVGAFAYGMNELTARGFVPAIRRVAESGVPLLGICVGMQVLLERSEEFGDHAGMGLIKGVVLKIPDTMASGERHKIPHIGWNELQIPESRADWQGSFLETTEPMQTAYFVHSYAASPADPSDVLATCDYNGRILCAAIARDNVFGCQFHPEKSGEAGLEMLRTFLAQ